MECKLSLTEVQAIIDLFSRLVVPDTALPMQESLQRRMPVTRKDEPLQRFSLPLCEEIDKRPEDEEDVPVKRATLLDASFKVRSQAPWRPTKDFTPHFGVDLLRTVRQSVQQPSRARQRKAP